MGICGSYSRYIEGKYTLGRDERDQIAFRLAHQLGLPKVHPVDYPMFMSGLTPSEIESPPPKPAAAVKDNAPAKEPTLSEEDLLLRNSTVREYLLHLNDPAEIRRSPRVRSHHGHFERPIRPPGGARDRDGAIKRPVLT